ncbi:hypothetical protein Tco_1447855 [Tanacetum coccineum]
MRADELYKFSDGTPPEKFWMSIITNIDFRLDTTRILGKVDDHRKKRSVSLLSNYRQTDRENGIIRNLERLVGAQELEMDYKLMTLLNDRQVQSQILSCE